jgi:3-phosphoshikimate 1-carboxyvinyltransferase
MLSACAEGRSRIENLGIGDDIRSTIRVLRQVGVGITVAPAAAGDTALVEGRGGRFSPPEGPLDCGNSATTMRLMAGLLAAQDFESVLTGDESLSSRPMEETAEPLRRMGAEVETGPDGRPPLVIRGKALTGIPHTSRTASAQTKSAVLLAGLFAAGETVVHEALQTRDHTERLLGGIGGPDLVSIDRLERTITVQGEMLPLPRFDLVIPGDPSAAAYPIALAALLPESSLTVPFVGLNAGRIAFFRHLQAMGAHLVMTPDAQAAAATGGEPVGEIAVHYTKLKNVPLPPERIPAMIDELPLLAVVACLAEGPWEIRNAERLRVKESDRIATTAAMLHSMGVEVEELDDGWCGPGGQELQGGVLESEGDHRIAMTAAVAAWCAKGETTLEGADCVAISFPGFFERMSDLAEYQ